MARLAPEDERRMTEFRQEIDELDRQLLTLLNRRAQCALEIGHIKKRNNEPIFVPEREQAVLKRLTDLNRGPLGSDAIVNVYQSIINEMKRLEESKSG
jgi:chorismate mutase/prephenate dehydratase